MHDVSMSDQVTLRPVSADDLPMLDALTQDSGQTGEFGWFGWLDRGRWRRGWDENGLIGPDGGTLVVARGDDQLGLVNWRRQQTTPAAYCWEIALERAGFTREGVTRGGGWRDGAWRDGVTYSLLRTDPPV